MQNKWPDFLFKVAVRFFCGVFVGVILGVVVGFFWGSGGRRYHSRPAKSFIVEHLNRDDYWPVVFWVGAWGLGAGIISIFTIPHWQAPWYKGIRNRDEDDHSQT